MKAIATVLVIVAIAAACAIAASPASTEGQQSIADQVQREANAMEIIAQRTGGGGAFLLVDANMSTLRVNTLLSAKILTLTDPNIAAISPTVVRAGILTLTDPNIAAISPTIVRAGIVVATDPNITPIPATSVQAADANAAAVPVAVSFVMGDANATLTYTVPAGKAFQVLDVSARKITAGGDGNTAVRVLTGTTAITDWMALSGAAGRRFTPTILVCDGNDTVAASGTLKVQTAKGDDANCSVRVTVLGKWVTP